MTLVQKFTEKYGINPIQLVADAHLKNLGLAKAFLNRLEKTQRLQRLLENYIEDKNLKIEVNNEFIKDLVECFAEAKEKFPENVKATVDTGTKFEIPNQMSSIPKSKGTLENFKDIVGTDDLRPIMMGVYVSEDGFIVGTDAHKLVKQKNNGLLSQTDYAGKIIDLTKYLKSNGKLIDFVDGVFPKYDAVIPRESPFEDRQLSTYAFYNYAKSSLEVKRLLNSDIFNVNFNLMTDTSGGTKKFSFGYHVLLDALNFAMLNNWDFFTLRYSEPNRAVLFDFGGDNVILVMPMIDRYDSSAEGGSTGTIPLTTEEVEEKYRLGLKQQKSSKPAKAPKKATVSAPVNSEPFKKFEGNLSDTTYIPRREIASITLRNGDVLSGNDVIDGFYRVNKKMAQGGGIDKQHIIFVTKNKKDAESYLKSKKYKEQYSEDFDDVFDLKIIEVPYNNFIDYRIVATKKYADGGSMYADGGGISKGMASGDISFLQKNGYYFDGEFYFEADGEFIEVVQGTSPSNPRKVAVLFRTNEPITISRAMLDKISSSFGKDFHIELFTNAGVDLHSSANRKYKNISVERLPQSKMAHGGSMYADGGNMFETPIAKYKEVSGKVVGSVPVSEEIYSSRVKDFVEYVYEVYEDYGFTKKQVKEAVDKYIKELGNQFTWGGGDSLDRERVYEYLRNPNLQGIKNPSFANGGSMSKSYEIGDIISFNSVMGGTKTGAIVSKLGEDGFRIKTEDGFATVKKSAIV